MKYNADVLSEDEIEFRKLFGYIVVLRDLVFLLLLSKKEQINCQKGRKTEKNLN